MLNALVHYPLINVTINIVFVIISICLLINLLTILKAKTLANRAIGLDAFGIQTMALIILYGIRHGSGLYVTAVLVLSILGFISLIVWSKYLHKGNIVYPLCRDEDDLSVIYKLKEPASLKKQPQNEEEVHL